MPPPGYLQRNKFGANAQPFYVIIDSKGKPLAGSYSYDENITHYMDFIETGLKNFKKKPYGQATGLTGKKEYMQMLRGKRFPAQHFIFSSMPSCRRNSNRNNNTEKLPPNSCRHGQKHLSL